MRYQEKQGSKTKTINLVMNYENRLEYRRNEIRMWMLIESWNEENGAGKMKICPPMVRIQIGSIMVSVKTIQSTGP